MTDETTSGEKQTGIVNRNISAERQPESIFRRGLLMLAFRSFEHSQGNQQLQVDVVEWAVKRWREKGIEIDETAESDLVPNIQRLRTPNGHAPVENGEVQAQFELWWANIWDVIRANYYNDFSYAPGVEELQNRATILSTEHQVPSLAKDKMDKVANRLHQHTPQMTSDESLTALLLPQLVKVEYGYQVDQPYHPIRGRQRTDNGDPCESRMLTNCQSALSKIEQNKPVTLFDEMYLNISHQLDILSPDDELFHEYKKLISAYNENHPYQQAENLHL